MGKIKTTLVRSVGDELYSKHEDKFKRDFESNKKTLFDLLDAGSKRLRNIIAGYITHLVKKKHKHNNKRTQHL